jgi:4-hydroxy-tetrahydrodipicolinate reductase
MNDLIRVLILGSGQMGSALVRVLLEKQGVEIVGACDREPKLSGTDLGQAVGLESQLGTFVEADLATVAHRCQPDVAIQATGSQLATVMPDIEILLSKGVSVISLAEEMAYPWYRSAATAKKMDELAVANNAVVLGTGINPGFILEPSPSLAGHPRYSHCFRIQVYHGAVAFDPTPTARAASGSRGSLAKVK